MHNYLGVLDMDAAAKADRVKELEADFCRLNDKLQHEQMVKNCDAEMFRIQGALRELARIPDRPKAEVGGDGAR